MGDVTRFMRETVTLTRVTRDGSEDSVGDLTSTTESIVVRCFHAPTSSSEVDDRRPLQVEERTVWFPPDVDIDGWDRITFRDGGMFDVVGPSRVWSRRGTQPRFVEVTARRVR